jgi:cyclic pyranopterin monophosphate synthase
MMIPGGDPPKPADKPPAEHLLTHTDPHGRASMVDVGDKPVTNREAMARGICRMQAATAVAIRGNSARKGDVLSVARVAGIMAAKRTDELIPLCHNLPLNRVDVDFGWRDECRLEATATVVCSGRTGVEMEALVAVTIACLTVYDMCKAMDREMCVENVELVRKSGGTRGDFHREPRPS